MEAIRVLQEELEAARNDAAEKQKAFALALKKERAAATRLDAAWQQQHGKIISTIKGIAGD